MADHMTGHVTEKPHLIMYSLSTRQFDINYHKMSYKIKTIKITN